MTVRYDKLWSLMKTNKMKKSDLAKAAEISQSTMTKLNQDRVVSMDVMLRLWLVLPENSRKCLQSPMSWKKKSAGS